MRERAYEKAHIHEEKMNKTFDRKIKEHNFHMNELVLKWDSRKEDKNGKFDHLWKGPYIVVVYRVDNTFILKY